MNLTLMLDSRFHNAAKMLGPEYAVYDMTNLGSLSGINNLPDVSISTLANYLQAEN